MTAATAARPAPKPGPALFRSVPDGPGPVPAAPPAAPLPDDQPLPGTPAPAEDAAAPYGRTATGRPKKKPGRKPGSGAPAGMPTAPPTTTRTKSTTRKKSDGPDYAGAVRGMLQLPTAALTLAGSQRPELLADAAALNTYGPGIAAALGELAADQPQVARLLDRVMTAGPYGALIAAVSPLVLQLLTNHKILKPGLMGTVPPAVLVQAVTGAAPAEAAAA